MPRRNHLTLILLAVSAFLTISFILAFRNQASESTYDQAPIAVTDSILYGEATAHKIENATLKWASHVLSAARCSWHCILKQRAELGNAAWKVLHTTMAKFPDKPTEEDSASLKSYIYLFARLYPCGDCARHFQKILKTYPPQVASRSTAAAWACHVHNEVNKSLKKEMFDCTKIGDFYDCGCAEDDKTTSKITQSKKDQFTPLELKKEG